MRISKTSLTEFKRLFPEYNSKGTRRSDTFHIITLDNNYKVGMIKHTDEGTHSFVNVDNAPVDKNNPNFEYELLSLFADGFERNESLENSYKETEDNKSLVEREQELADELSRLKRADQIRGIVFILVFAGLTLTALVIEARKYFIQ